MSSPHSALLSPPFGGAVYQGPAIKVFSPVHFEDQLSRFEVMVQLTFRATCTVLLLLVIYTGPASSEVPEGTWLLANWVAIQVFECSGLLCGKIVVAG